MEALISALGLVISTLMGVPALTVAATDAKKARIGKALFRFINALDTIISRGNRILDKIETIALASSDSDFQVAVEELRGLAEHQIESLEDIQEELRKGLKWEGVGLDLEMSALLEKTTDVQKVLSIYEPDLGQSLNVVLGFKRYLLINFARYFAQNLESLDRDNLTIKEIIFIKPNYLIVLDSLLDRYPEEMVEAEAQGLIKTQTLNLSSTLEREDYLHKARKRLSELQCARQKLTELIKRYYEPHHLY